MADSANIGYASLQVIPTVKDISGNTARQLGLPFQRAGQEAGRMAGEGIASGVEASAARVRGASEKVAKAQEAATTATNKLAIEEAKLQELRERGITGGSRYMAQSERVRQAQVRESQTRQGVTRATDELTEAERRAAEATDDLGGSVDDTGRKSLISKDNLVKFGLAAGAAVAGLGKVLYDIGGRFDDVSDTIRVSTGATGQSLSDMEEVVKRVGTTVPSSFEDIAGTVSDLNKRLGLTGPDLEQVSAQISELGNMGQEADMDSLTSSLNAFGIKGGDVSKTLDQLFQASQRTGVPITNLTQSVLKGGPALRQFGFDMGQSAGLIGTLNKSGLDADKMMGGLTKSLGVFAKEGQKPQEALKKNVVAIGDFIKAGDSAGALNLANKLFGVKGGAQFVEAVQTGKLSVEDFVKATGGGGDTIRGAAEDTRDFAEQWELFKNKGLVAIEPLATKVFGIIGTGMEWINTSGVPALMASAQWIDRNKVVLGIVAGIIATTLLPVLITSAAAWVKHGWEATVAAAKSLAASYKTVGGWILMGTTATKQAIVSSAAWIASGARSAGAWIALKAQAVGSFIATAAGATANAAVTTGAWVASGARSAGAWAAMKLAAVGSFIATGASAVVQSAITAGAWVASQGRMALSIGIATAAFIAQKVATVAGTVATGALTVAQWALNAAMSANPIGLVIAIVVALVAAIVLAYRNSETFRNIVQAAWQGIQVAASFAWNSILKPALDGFLAALGWVGDKAMWLWQNVMIPAWDGIKNAISTVWNFLRPILDNIGKGIHAVGEIASKVGDAMRNAFSGVVDVLKSPIHMVGKLLASLPGSVMGFDIPGVSTIKSWGETLQSLRVGGVVNNGMAGRTRNGVLWGPGSGTDDAILGVDAYGMPTALVSNKEGVVTADAMANGGAALVAWLNKTGGLPAFSTGGQVGEPYGLPTGSNISYGAPGFPDWVTKLGAEHNVKPSTYAGHQESDRNEAGYAPNPQHLNRGIDWSGSVEAMDAFARYLIGIAPDSTPLEQIIWQNPNTGAKVGWHGRTPDAGFSYFAADYGGHTDHVHTRQSAAFGGAVKPAIPETTTTVPGYVPPADLNPDGTNPNLQGGNTTSPTGSEPKKTRLKSFKELGMEAGGLVAEGIAEFFGLPEWMTDPQGYIDSNSDDGSNVRTSDDKGTTGNAGTPNTVKEVDPTKLREAEDKVTDKAEAARLAQLKLDEINKDPKASASRKEAAKVAKDKAEREAQQAKDDLDKLRQQDAAAKAAKNGTGTTTGDAAPGTAGGFVPDKPGGYPSAPTGTGLKGPDLYAFQIAKAAKDLGMGLRGATIGEATALVESGDPMKMYANNSDPASLKFPHDAISSDGSSSGLFQQQNNGAWGTAADRMDPYRSAKMFFNGLKGVAGWETMDMGAAAQAVQRSAFPDKYAGKMARGGELAKASKLFDTGGVWEPGTWGYNGLEEPELVIKRNQWGVMDRNAAVVERLANTGRGNDGGKLADTVNIQGYTAAEISAEWRKYQWSRTAGYGSSRNR